MFGWINDCTEKLVISKFGVDVWHEIKEVAGCSVKDGGFVRHQNYPDSSTVALVQAASKVLKLPVEAILETFGQFFMEFTRQEGYENLLQCQGSTLKSWLSNLNALHDHLASALPNGMIPPVFWCEANEKKAGTILLHYYSERGSLLVPVVVGVVKEVARYHFNLDINMTRMSMQDEGEAKFTTWTISAVNPRESAKVVSEETTISTEEESHEYLQQSMKPPSRSIGGMLRCPFTKMMFKKSDKKPTKPKIFEVQPKSSFSSSDISMNASLMQSVFPYHVVVDRSFCILQVGEKFPHLIFGMERGIRGVPIVEMLKITRPPLCSWNWTSMQKLKDQTFFVTTNGGEDTIKLKGTLKELDENKILFIFSPDVKNMNELHSMDLTLSDLPLHSFQRESVLQGEHIASEVRSYHTLDKVNRQMQAETSISMTLLNSMLPPTVVDRLRSGKWVAPHHYDNVTILFADVCGFTKLCDQLKSWHVVSLLNRLFKVMDYVADRFGIYKVETIGDCYVCASGLPTSDKNHAVNVANFAIAVQAALGHVTSPIDGKPIKLRFGMHSGSCTAGVIGNTAPRYCLFGDTMNTAARHESTGEPGRIQCSSTTYELLKDKFVFEKRGLVEMKGKGSQTTYWLVDTKPNTPGVVSHTEIFTINQKLLIQLSQVRTRQVYFKAEHKVINGDTMSDSGGSTYNVSEGSWGAGEIDDGDYSNSRRSSKI